MYSTETPADDALEPAPIPSASLPVPGTVETWLRRLERMDVRVLVRVFWFLSMTSILVWSLLPSYVTWWDVAVYKNAVLSLRAGHDPYADAIAVQKTYQLNPHAYQPGSAIPFSYVYSPMTLPALRAIAVLPFAVSVPAYWVLYFCMIALGIWAMMRLPEGSERNVFRLLVPFAVFFPAMLASDNVLSGNVAYILYALVLGAAVYGWQRGRWAPFYVAVLLAGCVKTPMLTLLAIPIFSGRRQWLPAIGTGTAGAALFAVQPLLWPQLFHDYLQAVDLQFQFNRDFSSSPAGLVSNALFFRVPYKISSPVCYLSYAAVILVVLFLLSRRYFAGRLTIEQFAPVLLVGTILLNPRIMEYDLAPITVPVALIVWRVAGRGRSLVQTVVGMTAVFAVINIIASRDHVGLSNPPWKITAGCFIVIVFAAGAWALFRRANEVLKPVLVKRGSDVVEAAA